MEDDYFLEKLLGLAWGLAICAAIWLLCGCTAQRPVVVERVRTDTAYVDRWRTDSFCQRDSVYVETFVKGDTVYRNKTVTQWRDHKASKADTVYKSSVRTDTIRVPYPVEHKATWWERNVEQPLYTLLKLAVAAVAVWAAVRLAVWIRRRYGERRNS